MQDMQDFDALRVANAFLGPSVVEAIVFIGTVAGVERVAEYYILMAGFGHEASHLKKKAEARLGSVLVPVLDRR